MSEVDDKSPYGYLKRENAELRKKLDALEFKHHMLQLFSQCETRRADAADRIIKISYGVAHPCTHPKYNLWCALIDDSVQNLSFDRWLMKLYLEGEPCPTST